jgi:polyhydroxybutyrate depolymerase
MTYPQIAIGWISIMHGCHTLARLLLLTVILASALPAKAQKIKFTSGGLERSYILHLPRSYNASDASSYPVILCLHGKGSNGREMKMYTGLNKTGDDMNSIIAYPTTTGESWPYTDTIAIRTETKYLLDIIQHLASHYKADQQHVYMTGMSSGGIFTFTFASRYPAVLKGIAIISGNITYLAKEDIENNATILPPLLLIHGTGDDILYEGRAGLCMSAEESFGTYRHSCLDRAPVSEWMPDLKKDKCTVEKITYTCPQKMIYYRITNGGHHWPGANFDASLFTSLRLGRYCKDMNANDAIKSFVLAIETGA